MPVTDEPKPAGSADAGEPSSSAPAADAIPPAPSSGKGQGERTRYTRVYTVFFAKFEAVAARKLVALHQYGL